MPGPWHLPGIPLDATVSKIWIDGILVSEGTVEVAFTPLGKAFVEDLCAVARIRQQANDPASLARYGVAREHPGDPGPRPGELPWVGKAKKGRKR